MLVAVFGLQFVQSGFFHDGQQAGVSANPAAAPAVMGIRTLVLLESARGDATARFSGAPPYLLQLDAGQGNAADAFTVVLRDVAQKQLVNQANLQADADGWVRLVLNQKLAGDYVVSLSWTDNAGAAHSREFPVAIGE